MENLAPANIYRSKLALPPGLNYHSTLKDRSLILVVQTSQMSLKLEFGFRRIETYGEIQNKECVSCLRLIRNWMTNHVKYGIRGLKRMLNRFFFLLPSILSHSLWSCSMGQLSHCWFWHFAFCCTAATENACFKVSMISSTYESKTSFVNQNWALAL